MESEPPCVGCAKQWATNLIPVGLRVGNAGNGLTFVGTADWPSGFSDPNRLSLCDSNGSLVGIVEDSLGLADRVVNSGLVEWIFINAEEVGVGNDWEVGAVGPRVPGINVTDRDLGPGGARNSGSGLIDVAVDHVGTGAGSSIGTGQTSGGDTVEILTADRDTRNGASEAGECLDGGRQGGDFVGEIRITT